MHFTRAIGNATRVKRIPHYENSGRHGPSTTGKGLFILSLVDKHYVDDRRLHEELKKAGSSKKGWHICTWPTNE